MFRSNIKLYNFFKRELKLPGEKAEELVNSLDEKGQLDIETAATRYKSLWKEDLTKLDTALRGEMKQLELNLKDLRGELKDTKNELLMWVFGAFLTVILTIIGLYFKD